MSEATRGYYCWICNANFPAFVAKIWSEEQEANYHRIVGRGIDTEFSETEERGSSKNKGWLWTLSEADRKRYSRKGIVCYHCHKRTGLDMRCDDQTCGNCGKFVFY